MDDAGRGTQLINYDSVQTADGEESVAGVDVYQGLPDDVNAGQGWGYRLPRSINEVDTRPADMRDDKARRGGPQRADGAGQRRKWAALVQRHVADKRPVHESALRAKLGGGTRHSTCGEPGGVSGGNHVSGGEGYEVGRVGCGT